MRVSSSHFSDTGRVDEFFDHMGRKARTHWLVMVSGINYNTEKSSEVDACIEVCAISSDYTPLRYNPQYHGRAQHGYETPNYPKFYRTK